jgi:hypothetical protein
MQQQTTATKRAREPSVSSDQEDRSGTPVDVFLSDSNDQEEAEESEESWTSVVDGATSESEDIPELPPNEQLAYIQNLKDSKMEEGQTWYLVANRWYSRWKQHCTRLASQSPSTREIGRKSPPGKVNNTSITEGNRLKADLASDIDFHLVPEKAWKALVKW